MGLRVAYRGREQILPEGVVAVIGADPNASVRVARPGISRRHAVLKYDTDRWVVQDTASRNGTYHDGTRIQTLDLVGPTSLQLGHPTDGEAIELEPTANAAVSADTSASAAASPVVTPTPTGPASMEPTRVAPPTPSPTRDREIDELVTALRETMKSVRALAWSVWAMIAATAILAILTLFVGIVGN